MNSSPNDLNATYSYNKVNEARGFSPVSPMNRTTEFYQDRDNISTMNNLKDVLRKIDNKYYTSGSGNIYSSEMHSQFTSSPIHNMQEK